MNNIDDVRSVSPQVVTRMSSANLLRSDRSSLYFHVGTSATFAETSSCNRCDEKRSDEHCQTITLDVA